jgi:hypothetical protein
VSDRQASGLDLPQRLLVEFVIQIDTSWDICRQAFKSANACLAIEIALVAWFDV